MIAVHLIIDGNSVPGTADGVGLIGYVELGGFAVESYGLIEQRVIGLTLDFNGYVVPGVVEEFAGGAGGDPVFV